MSETNTTSNNPSVGVVESSGTGTVVDIKPQDVVEFRKKNFQGKDAVADALTQAKLEAATAGLKSDSAKVEDLSSVEGLDDGGHKGIDYNKVISTLPDDARALLSNLRADYTRKTQELATQRKELETMRDSLIKGANGFLNSELTNGETVELDPYDTQSFEKRIQQEVLRRMQEMVKPLQEEQYTMQRRNELERFKSEHPDLMEYKTEVATLLKSNESLSLQDAYFIVKGQKLSTQNAELKSQLEERNNRMREVGKKISQGTNAKDLQQLPSHLKKGHEIYAYLNSQKSKK